MGNLYQGKAEIVCVDGSELKEYQKRGLSDEQAQNGFNIILTLKPENESFGEAEMEIEISARECEGKMAGRIQSDISMEQLRKQGLISESCFDCLEEMFPKYDDEGNCTSKGCVGKYVQIYQKEKEYEAHDGTMKTRVNTYFSSFSRLPKDVLAKRLAMLRGGAKPAPKTAAPASNPFA